MDNRQKLEIKLMAERPYCEGQEYKEHVCSGPRTMHESLYTKRNFQGLPASKRAYLDHPMNCVILCEGFHGLFGHTKQFREWWRTKMIVLHGAQAVKDYLMSAPLKVKTL